MKQKFTFLIAAAVMLLAIMLQPVRLWGQATTYTSNVTLPTSGTNVYSCNVSISSTTYSAVRLGKKSTTGSGSITVPSGTVKLFVHCAGWSGETGNLTLSTSATGVTITPSTMSLTADSGISGSSSTYTLNASNASTSYFKEFTLSGVTTTTTITLTSPNNKRCVVWGVNAVIAHTLTYSATNGGIVGVDAGSNAVASGASVAEGATVTLTATPDTGYSFTGWSVSGTGSTLSSTSDNPTTFTMGTANATVTANFLVASGYITVSPTIATPTCAAEDVVFSIDTDQTLDDNPVVFYTTSTGDETTEKPAWIGDILYAEGELFVEVNANTGAARTAYFRVEEGSVKSDVITINQAVYAPAAPIIPATTSFDYTMNVTMSQEAGKTIYYTTDGSTPSNSSTEYTGAFDINATTTVKAIAYDGTYPSAVVSATYTRTYDYISSISSTSTNYTIKGTVVAISNVGFIIGDGTGYVYDYKSDHGQSVGNMVSFTEKKPTTYNHVYEFKEIPVAATTSAYTSGTPTAITADDIDSYTSGNHLSEYVQLMGTFSTTGSVYKLTNSSLYGDYTIQVYNPTSDQADEMNDYDGKTVKVKGYFAGFNANSSPSTMYIMLESIEACPVITTTATSLTGFTYNVGSGPSTSQNFNVNASNLTVDITVALSATSSFEMSEDNSTFSTDNITISKGPGSVSNKTIYVRLKSGLASGTYTPHLTLSSDGAENVMVSLNGTVTRVIAYNTSLPTGCSVSSEPTDAQVYNESVSVSATAGSGYKFSAWDVYKTGESSTKVTVTNNTFTMPDYNVTVSATFVEAYSVTYNANGGTGEMSDPDSPYASGSTVKVLFNDFKREGYEFSSWNTKSDGSGDHYDPDDEFLINADTTLYAQWGAKPFNVALSSVANVDLLASYGDEEEIAEGADADVAYGTEITLSASNMADGKVFIWAITDDEDNDVTDDVLDGDVLTVPAYDITIGGQVAELFFKYSGELTEGDYIIADGSYAMLNTLNSNRFNRQTISPSNNQIIVANASTYLWHIASSGDYWTIYNAAEEKYACSTGSASQANLGGNSDDKCLFSVSGTTTYTFVSKYNSELSTPVNAQLCNGGTYWACYKSGSNTLYKKAVGSKHSVAIATGITNGSVEATPSSAYEGQTVSLTATPSSGYMLDSWDVYKTDDTSTKITVNNNTFTMPGYDVTVSATFRVQHTYTLVDGSDVTLVPGKHYIIASTHSTNYYVMGAQNDNVRSSVTASLSGSKILEDKDFYEVVISGSGTTAEPYTMYSVRDEGYMYSTGASKANIGTRKDNVTTNPTYGQWTISISSGTATITSKAGTGYTDLEYNHNGGSNSRFACYSSGQTAVKLYVRDGDKDLEFHSPTTLESLTIANNETYTVESGQVLEVSGALTNNGTAANLVIEDGGQLITKSSGVNATVKKNIEQATNWGTGTSYDADGWYFIASPVNGAAFPTGTVANQDIFQLDWANNKWLNLQYSGNSALLSAGFQRGTGYLYASKDGNTLSVAGEIKPLTEADTAKVILKTTGWNLIGNPLTCKVTVDCAFSELVKASAVTNKEANSVINPCQGIAVYGDAGTEVTFTKAATQDAVAPSNNNSLQMTLAKTITSRGDVSTKVVDNAVVSFKESKCMPKFNMIGGNTKLFIPQDDEEYSVVFSDRQGDVPLYFKANETGTYTISFAGDEMSLNGIYLIDILAEEEIDLSVNPSYTFIGSPADRMARFKIVFRNTGGDGTSDIFAYQNDNDIIVSGEGELQIFDVMGRMVSRQRVNGVETVNAMPYGVYIFKLNGMTQKIVVR